MSIPRQYLGFALVLLATVQPLPAQVVPVDDAVFELSVNGTVVGEEHVTLHRMGLGQDARIIGQSEIRMADGSEMRPRVEADTEMRASRYQNRFTGAETGEVTISRAGRRLVAVTHTASGEAQREFRASDQTVILEDRVVLLYYLLEPWATQGEATLTVLDPRSNDQARLALREVGSERMRMGRRTVMARHLRMGDGTTRDIWFDEEGRVIRVEIPAVGFVAERQAP